MVSSHGAFKELWSYSVATPVKPQIKTLTLSHWKTNNEEVFLLTYQGSNNTAIHLSFSLFSVLRAENHLQRPKSWHAGEHLCLRLLVSNLVRVFVQVSNHKQKARTVWPTLKSE